MAHRHEVYQYGNYIEHEYKYAGRCGKKGEKREPRGKASTEQIKKQNQWNKEKKVLRKLRYNFQSGDLWLTLKLPKGTRMPPEEILSIRDKFFRKLRDAYKKKKTPLKYIYRIEIGERGGIHIHTVINRLGCSGTAQIVSDIWNFVTGGHVHFTPLYAEGDYKALADYIVKPMREEITGQLTLFGEEEEKKIFAKYGCSRNLKEPEPDVKEYKRRTVEKLVEEGPVPTEGYYIDRDSIRTGINPYTGLTYYYYTEIRLGEQIVEDWSDVNSA